MPFCLSRYSLSILYIMLRKEDLNLMGLKIYQDDSLYCFTSDAVLLSRFARVKKGDTVADFCSGSGIVGLHLYGLNADKISTVTLFEMQKEMFDLSVKSISENNLEDKFFAVNTKLQDIDNSYHGKFSLIVCNPPYAKKDSGEIHENEVVANCKAEMHLTLEELMDAANKCLKFGGRINIVHRADRLVEIIYEMKRVKIEPKIVCPVAGDENKDPYLVLVEGVKGGKSGLKLLKTIKN